jgi:hypothetical protein
LRSPPLLSDDEIPEFGEPPNLEPEPFAIWRLHWNGQAYEIQIEQFDDDMGEVDPAQSATIAFRRLPGHRRLYVAQVDGGDAVDFAGGYAEEDRFVHYWLIWRMKRNELVAFDDILYETEHCSAVGPENLARLGLKAEDIENCRFDNWEQLEAVMSAYVATKPTPIGSLRKVRSR